MVLVDTTPGCHRTTTNLGSIGPGTCSREEVFDACEQIAGPKSHDILGYIVHWDSWLTGQRAMTKLLPITNE